MAGLVEVYCFYQQRLARFTKLGREDRSSESFSYFLSMMLLLLSFLVLFEFSFMVFLFLATLGFCVFWMIFQSIKEVELYRRREDTNQLSSCLCSSCVTTCNSMLLFKHFCFSYL